jgi:sugar (pentulose or hexulose) kinase
MDASTGGAFLGLRVSTRRPEIYRAVLEGICFEMKYNIEVLEGCGIHLDNVAAVGGGSESDVLMQIKANIWDRDIHTLKCAQAGTAGLAILCGCAMGIYKSMEDAATDMARPGKCFSPQPEAAGKYKARMDIYRRMYKGIKGILG